MQIRQFDVVKSQARTMH